MLKLLLCMAGAVAAPQVVQGQDAEGPGWYSVQFGSQDALTVRLLSEDGDSYLFDFQGSVLRVQKTKVRRLSRLSPEEAALPKDGLPKDALPNNGRPAASAPGAAKPGAPAGAHSGAHSGDREEAIRDAVESLASTDAAASRKAYKLLESDFSAARPLLHMALRHQSPAVRLLAVKLLGEKGNSAEDLSPVLDRLVDEHGSVRLAAVMATRLLGTEGLPKLIEYLGSEPNAGNRKVAIKTLQRWQDPRAVPPLVQHLWREKDPGVSSFVVAALERLTRRKLGSDPQAWSAYLVDEEQRAEIEKMAGVAGGKDRGPAAPRGKE